MSRLFVFAAMLISVVAGYAVYPGVPADFFMQGDAFISGRIKDYDRNLGFDNISFLYTNPLTLEKSLKSVPLEDDGSFSIAIAMVAPGFITLDGGNNWISARYYAEPSRTLYVEFDFNDMKRLREENPGRYRIGQRITRFGGDTGEINSQIAACPLLKKVDLNALAYNAVPRVAADSINAIYARNQAIVRDYIASSYLHPLSERLLQNEPLSERTSAFTEYEKFRRLNRIAQPDAPSLSENPDAGFYDWWKDVLTGTDEWFLASGYMDGTQANFLYSNFPLLFDAETRHKYRVNYNPMQFLKSKGVRFGPEEEELARWYDEHEGTYLYLTENDIDDYFNKIRAPYQLAISAGIEQDYKDFLTEINQRLKDSGYNEDNSAVPYNVTLMADTIRRFTGNDEVPLLWQVIQTNILTGCRGLDAESYTVESMAENLNEIMAADVITCEPIKDALLDFYERAYTPKDFVIPDNENGRIIKEIIAPHQGKILLIDFWGTTCGPCRTHIENSAEERKRNLNHPDFKRIFIASEGDSSYDTYREYVAKHLDGETTVRLSDSDFRKLMELFNFTALPHYVLLDRTGNVLNPNVKQCNLRSTLQSALSDLGIKYQ